MRQIAVQSITSIPERGIEPPALRLLVSYTLPATREYWMDDFAAPGRELAVATDPKINKLGDEWPIHPSPPMFRLRP
jgi:hypothetical protein